MPELGSINLGPGQPRQRGTMDPIPLIKQQGQQQLANLDKEWSDKYQQLNKSYDWSRHEKRPDEITRLRGRLEQDITGRRQAVQAGMQQTISKFAMLDHLFPDQPEVANKLKWTAAVGKEVANQMFPGDADPRMEHQRNLAEQNRLIQTTDAFVIEGGKLYASAEDELGYYTGKANTGKPATPEEIQLWAMSGDALTTLEQREQDILGQMSDMGMPDPFYLQSLYTAQRRKGFFGKLVDLGAAFAGPSVRVPRKIKEYVGYASEPNGTFAQKVGRTVTRKPSTGRKLTVDVARKYLAQHGGNRQAAMAAAAADGYGQ